jgi:multidrug efflux pump subunit AcrB
VINASTYWTIGPNAGFASRYLLPLLSALSHCLLLSSANARTTSPALTLILFKKANPAIDGYEFAYYKHADSSEPEKSVNVLEIELVRVPLLWPQPLFSTL